MIKTLRLIAAVALLSLAAVAAAPADARFTSSPDVAGNVFTSDLLSAPTSLSSSGGSTISLSWTATSDTYASGHRVLRGAASGGPYTQVSEITPRATTTYNETPPAGAYYYVTRAFYGNWESADSNETSATISSSTWLATGSFAGDGVDNRTITGVGFTPDVVIVKCDCGQDGVVRTSTMVGDASKVISTTSALAADQVQSLDATGFTVGTSLRVNGSGNTYHWIAMQAGTNLNVGSYAGNATDNRSITGVGFQPAWVMTLGDAQNSIFRPGTVSGDVSFLVHGSGQLTDRIQAMQADGFQLGTNVDVNQSGVTFHYIAWKASASVVVQTTYVGNGVDNTSITGAGFSPAFVWVKRDTTNASSWRSDTFVGDSSTIWDGAFAANSIQALEASGFQVGTNARVNTNGATYHYLALKP
ncbi:MAG TPA: hypothetical protein VI759_02995 [Dehalococcoidia bacterium]|nr:hypothetical protein [Dehalococcoidia bacterium]